MQYFVEHVVSNEANESIAHEYSKYANVQFAMAGGIVFLFLVINGPTSGPLLKRLGLVMSTENRNKIIEKYRRNVVQQTIRELLALLTDKRFEDLDFAVVKAYIPFLSE
jgi:hypothetical protein